MNEETNESKPDMEYYSTEFFMEDNTTELVVQEAKDGRPAVVIHSYTKASKERQKTISKHKVNDVLRMNANQEIILDKNLSLSKKKALADIVIKITGLGPEDVTGEDVKTLFLNPRARKLPAWLNAHLDTLGNEPKE